MQDYLVKCRGQKWVLESLPLMSLFRWSSMKEEDKIERHYPAQSKCNTQRRMDVLASIQNRKSCIQFFFSWSITCVTP